MNPKRDELEMRIAILGVKLVCERARSKVEQHDIEKVEKQLIEARRMLFRRREPRFIVLPAGSCRIFY